MKKYLFIAILITFCSSCSHFNKRDISPITSTISAAENIVKEQDNMVLSSIENENFDDIIYSTDIAIDSINAKIDLLNNLTVEEDEVVLKSEAIKYLNSMLDIIESLRDYSSLTNSTTLSEAVKLDRLNHKAINLADSAYQRYNTVLKKFQ